jgi:uncharacterized protein YceH (UPF0502 family)
MELDRTEARILGALVEKRWTVPDQYPLSLNALVAACNQKSNRDPVLHLEEFEVSGCLMGLRQRGLVIVHEQYGGRVPRYSEKVMEELSVSREEMAILAELMLRGPQTAGELFRRCKRMASFVSQQQVDAMLRDLAGGHFVYLQPKASGQRYARWDQRLCVVGASPAEPPAEPPAPTEQRDTADHPAPAPALTPPGAPSHAPAADGPDAGRRGTAPPPASDAEPSLRDELRTLRDEVASLRHRVAELEDLVAGGG